MATTKIPLEKISIAISPLEREQLQKLADERNRSLSSMGRLAIQAYLYAIRHQKKKKAAEGMKRQLNHKE